MRFASWRLYMLSSECDECGMRRKVTSGNRLNFVRRWLLETFGI